MSDLPDINVLLAALNANDPAHPAARCWLDECLREGRQIALAPMVEAGFLRIATNARIYKPPVDMAIALAFLDALQQTGLLRLAHWTPATQRLWHRICLESDISGNDVNDCMLAAIAIDGGMRLVSFDQGFSRFEGLSWHVPAAPAQ